LTAQRFASDPFAARPGGRLFRTGDVGRLLSDGQVAFVRRTDDQIKVRGFRVEPTEIEAMLNRHPCVSQSVVVARQASRQDRQLIGYLVPAPQGPPNLRELRDFLRVGLPDYMVPDLFVKLESLPLSANGKIDRFELPAPSAANTLPEAAFTAPRTELEKTVADILGGLLGLERVDVEGNFFVLGGHSLLGAQLINRVRQVFGVEMSLRVLFDAPTVADLSAEIERLLALKRERLNDDKFRGVLESAAQAGIGH
jgi:acyl carrier protein